MDVNITFQDFATPGIEDLMRCASPAVLAEAVREPCRKFWQDRISSLPPNKQGYKSTRFWEKCARTVQGTANGGSVILEAGDDKEAIGLRQRYYGGPIPIGGPKAGPQGVLLAIPISEESHGKVPADFGDALSPAFRVVNGELRSYLVLNSYKIGPRGGKVVAGQKFMFRLKGQVFQNGNPQVVPTEDEFAGVCLGAIERSLR